MTDSPQKPERFIPRGCGKLRFRLYDTERGQFVTKALRAPRAFSVLNDLNGGTPARGAARRIADTVRAKLGLQRKE